MRRGVGEEGASTGGLERRHEARVCSDLGSGLAAHQATGWNWGCAGEATDGTVVRLVRGRTGLRGRRLSIEPHANHAPLGTDQNLAWLELSGNGDGMRAAQALSPQEPCKGKKPEPNPGTTKLHQYLIEHP